MPVKSKPKASSLVANWHPVKYKALTVLTEREASPKELAPLVGEPRVSNVSWHIRQMEAAGLVEEVRTEQRRGATEHYFKAVARPILTDEEWQELPEEARAEFSATILQLWSMDLNVARKEGTLDACPERHFTRTPLQLDAQGFRDLTAAVNALFYRALEIQGESDQRRVETGEDSMRVSALLGAFKMPDVSP